MDEDAPIAARPIRRLRPRVAGALATLAMGSWVVLGIIPIMVAIVALT